MSKEEILCTPVGEMLDMLSCLSIYEGGAQEKQPKHKMSMIEFLKLE
jgi:hypothetical protein